MGHSWMTDDGLLGSRNDPHPPAVNSNSNSHLYCTTYWETEGTSQISLNPSTGTEMFSASAPNNQSIITHFQNITKYEQKNRIAKKPKLLQNVAEDIKASTHNQGWE